MLIDNKRSALRPALIGALLGMAALLIGVWVMDAMPFTGSVWSFRSPLSVWLELFSFAPLGCLLYLLLWGLFGAEVGVATLPFADEGGDLLFRSLCHFGVMALTLWGWVLLQFHGEPWPGLALTFLLPFTLIYVLVWLGRWVGWYAEVGQIRERLGLSPAPSLLKWRESLPHIVFALFLCLAVPLVLRLCDAPDVPVLSGLLYPYLLLPVAGFSSALSLGKRQGFCPLYPLSCTALTALFALSAKLWFHTSYSALPLIALFSSLLGNGLGALVRRRKQRGAVEYG